MERALIVSSNNEVAELAELLLRCYREDRLPGPEEPAWAAPGECVEVARIPRPFTLG